MIKEKRAIGDLDGPRAGSLMEQSFLDDSGGPIVRFEDGKDDHDADG